MVNELMYKNKQRGIVLHRYLAEKFCRNAETLLKHIESLQSSVPRMVKMAAFTYNEYIIEYYLIRDLDNIFEVITNIDGIIIEENAISIPSEFPAYFEDLTKVIYKLELSDKTVDSNIENYLPYLKMTYSFNKYTYFNNDKPFLLTTIPEGKEILINFRDLEYIKLFDRLFDEDIAKSESFSNSMLLKSIEPTYITGLMNTKQVFENGSTIFSSNFFVNYELDIKEHRIYMVDSRRSKDREFIVNVGILPTYDKNPKARTVVRIILYEDITKVFETSREYEKTISEVMSDFADITEIICEIYFNRYGRYLEL